MDYEKKYKEAVNKIRDLLNDGEKNGFTIVTYKTDLESIFPELAESKDERIRKALINIFATHKDYEVYFGVSVEDIRVWLEKQGEQLKEATYTYEAETGNGNIKALVTEKVQLPKFKVGDWVVYYRKDSSREVIQVYDIRDDRYYFTDNVHFSWSVKECDEKCHLWSIQDAKAGDVLTDIRNCTCIFREIMDDDGETSVDAFCGITIDNKFVVNKKRQIWSIPEELFPATEEQRDILFKKMRECGYEWDAENKKLRTI